MPLKPATPLGDPADTAPAAVPKPPSKPRAPSGQFLPTGSPSKQARYKRRLKERKRQAIAQVYGEQLPGSVAGSPGDRGGDAGRARRALNLATIRGLQDAFDRGGQKAIDQVMRENPAIFLKMLVLLVPREMEITHSGGVKAMTDEALDAAIETLERMLNAKVIDGKADGVSANTP